MGTVGTMHFSILIHKGGSMQPFLGLGTRMVKRDAMTKAVCPSIFHDTVSYEP